MGGQSLDLGGAPYPIYQIQEVQESGTTLAPQEPKLRVRQMLSQGGSPKQTDGTISLLLIKPGFDKREIRIYGAGRQFSLPGLHSCI